MTPKKFIPKKYLFFWKPQKNVEIQNFEPKKWPEPMYVCKYQSTPTPLGFEPHHRHCIVSLSKTHLSLLSTGSTQEDLFRQNWKIVDWDVKNQIKQNKIFYSPF